MATGELVSTIAIGALRIHGQATRTDDTALAHDLVLPAGKAGTLTTRTDDDTGVATLSQGHGITDTDTVCVFWEGGVRYGMDVTSVDGDAVSIDLGNGDVLPALDTAIVVTPEIEIDSDFDGDNLKMIAAACDQRAHVHFTENADTSILARELVANEPWTWVAGQGIANPLTGNPVGKIQAACGTAVAGTVKVAGILNNA